MSRIGKAPVEIPGAVSVELSGRSVKVNGPKGELTVPVGRGIEVRQEDGNVIVERATDTPEHRAMHGLTRSLIHNAVTDALALVRLGRTDHPDLRRRLAYSLLVYPSHDDRRGVRNLELYPLPR